MPRSELTRVKLVAGVLHRLMHLPPRLHPCRSIILLGLYSYSLGLPTFILSRNALLVELNTTNRFGAPEGRRVMAHGWVRLR